MPLTARRFIRKMRGGAQSHLLQADDDRYYIVKFRNNPQHRRILVNELVSAELLRYLQISAPDSAVIHVTAPFLQENPEVHLTAGSRVIPVEAGRHFGSRYPGDPLRMAVYDFVPDALLSQVANLSEFAGILVFDKWVANADGRQSIFFQARLEEWSPGAYVAPGRRSFVARMIDHGYAFNGPSWDFIDSEVQGLYPRRVVYEGVRSFEDFQPWLDHVVHFPVEVLDRAYRRVPAEWIEDEEDDFHRLLERLRERCKRVPSLLKAMRDGRSNPFPNWK